MAGTIKQSFALEIPDSRAFELVRVLARALLFASHALRDAARPLAELELC